MASLTFWRHVFSNIPTPSRCFPLPLVSAQPSSQQLHYEAVCERERRAALRNAALLQDLQRLREQMTMAVAAVHSSSLPAQRVSQTKEAKLV